MDQLHEGVACATEGELTSTSFSLVISPVDDWPAGVGLSDVQWSPMRGADGAGEALDVDASGVGWASASLSGAFVDTSGSAIVMMMGSRLGFGSQLSEKELIISRLQNWANYATPLKS